VNESRVYVWDRFIRFYHWSQALLFVLLYLSATYEFDDIHFLLAYLLTALLAARLIWGFISTGYGRFSSFLFSLSETISYVKGMLAGHTKRYLGHNPIGAWSIYLFLSLLSIMVVTGSVMLTWGEYEGPLWAAGVDFADSTAHICRWLHETSTDLLLIMVALHLGGVAFSSIKHHENLVAAMWHGKKKGED